MDNNQTMQVDINALKDDLEHTLEDSTLVQEDNTVDTKKYLDSIRVKYNKEATKVDEIYQIHDIISADLLNRLETEAEKLLETEIDHIP